MCAEYVQLSKKCGTMLNEKTQKILELIDQLFDGTKIQELNINSRSPLIQKQQLKNSKIVKKPLETKKSQKLRRVVLLDDSLSDNDTIEVNRRQVKTTENHLNHSDDESTARLHERQVSSRYVHNIGCSCHICDDELVYTASQSLYLTLTSDYRSITKIWQSRGSKYSKSLENSLLRLNDAISVCSIPIIPAHSVSLFCQCSILEMMDVLGSGNWAKLEKLTDHSMDQLSQNRLNIKLLAISDVLMLEQVSLECRTICNKFKKSDIVSKTSQMTRKMKDLEISHKVAIRRKPTVRGVDNRQAPLSSSKIENSETYDAAIQHMEAQLQKFGHLAFYEWYRRTNMFLASNKKSTLNFVETFSISTYHLGLFVDFKKKISG